MQNPAFGPVQIRALTGIFLQKAIEVRPFRLLSPAFSLISTIHQLRDVWSSQIESYEKTADPNSKGVRIDVLSWLSRATLDIIGLAGASTLSVAFIAYKLSSRL
jgi:hypothetical protein